MNAVDWCAMAGSVRLAEEALGLAVRGDEEIAGAGVRLLLGSAALLARAGDVSESMLVAAARDAFRLARTHPLLAAQRCADVIPFPPERIVRRPKQRR